MSSAYLALIAEKEKAVIKDIADRLFSMGHHFIAVYNQLEVYQQLQEKRFDYVLLSHCLPVYDNSSPNPEAGFNILECIRNRLGISEEALPIIGMSRCWNDMETGARLIQAGANACIPIPVIAAREPLEAKIKRVLLERKPHLVESYHNQQITLLASPPPYIPPKPTPQKPLLEIDVPQELVYYRGQRIHLQQMQFKLLLTLALRPDAFLSKQNVIYTALFGEPDADEDCRPYERQIDNAKSKLVRAFTPVLGEKAKDLILTQPKVGIKLNLAEREIIIIGKSGNTTSHEPKENSTTLFDLPKYPPPSCHQKPSVCNRHCFL